MPQIFDLLGLWQNPLDIFSHADFADAADFFDLFGLEQIILYKGFCFSVYSVSTALAHGRKAKNLRHLRNLRDLYYQRALYNLRA